MTFKIMLSFFLGHPVKQGNKTISKIPSCELKCRVAGKRVNRGAGYGLEIPVIYELVGAEKAVEWGQKKH